VLVNQINYISAVFGFCLINLIFLTFSGNYEDDKADRSMYLNVVGLTIHIHHWMLGLMGLLICLCIEQYFGRNLVLSFLKGVFFGSIFDRLTYYVDYFDVIKPRFKIGTKN
jgi:hypothetical protein